jgi:hypothetical protein
MNHPHDSLLHDFVDDELSPDDRARITIHLGECPTCRGVVDGLRELREEARRVFGASSPEHAVVPPDQWARIRERLPAPRRAGGTEAGRSAHHRSSWFAPLPIVMLRRAAMIIMVVGASSVTTWWVVRSGPEPGADSPSVATTPVAATTTGQQSATLIVAAYQPVISDLERLLDEGRGRLQPETIQILEENLRIIDAAITDSEEALLSDPRHPAVLRSLDGALQAKLDLLREAVGLTRGA